MFSTHSMDRSVDEENLSFSLIESFVFFVLPNRIVRLESILLIATKHKHSPIIFIRNKKIGKVKEQSPVRKLDHHETFRSSSIEKKKGSAPIKAHPAPVQATAPPPALSTIANGIKPPSANSLTNTHSPVAPAPAPTATPKSTASTAAVSNIDKTISCHLRVEATTQKHSGFFTLRSKKTAARPDISAPIQST